MSLTKCSECGQEVSTEAKVCPHCGNPNMPGTIEQKNKKENSWITIVGILLGVLMFVGLYFLVRGIVSSTFGLNTITPSVPQQSSPSGQAISLQEVKNLGYDFYVGQIDSAGNNNLTDDLKNQITKVAYNAHVPINILKSVPIIILNNLALTGDQYISIGGVNLRVPDLKPDFLSEGGLYLTFDGGLSTIFINKPIIAQGQLTEVLTHELGHAIGSKLTDEEWTRYYQLRNISSSTDRHGTNWNLSPEEDFAEVYKNTFTGIAVRTYYGLLLPSQFESMMETTCGQIYSKVYSNYLQQFKETNTCPALDFSNMNNGFDKCLGQVQKNPTPAQIAQAENVANGDSSVQICRRDVLSNPSKYPSDWRYSIPYKITVSQAAKDFIVGIANRLNQK